MADSLFDILVQYTGVDYLSDLHLKNVLPAIISCLESIEDDKFNVAQWNDVLSYVTSDKLKFQTVPQAKL
ncbi:MAG: hypothetical protein RR253_03110, partial [Oscillospiraceae bacterium]